MTILIHNYLSTWVSIQFVNPMSRIPDPVRAPAERKKAPPKRGLFMPRAGLPASTPTGSVLGSTALDDSRHRRQSLTPWSNPHNLYGNVVSQCL